MGQTASTGAKRSGKGGAASMNNSERLQAQGAEELEKRLGALEECREQRRKADEELQRATNEEEEAAAMKVAYFEDREKRANEKYMEIRRAMDMLGEAQDHRDNTEFKKAAYEAVNRIMSDVVESQPEAKEAEQGARMMMKIAEDANADPVAKVDVAKARQRAEARKAAEGAAQPTPVAPVVEEAAAPPKVPVAV